MLYRLVYSKCVWTTFMKKIYVRDDSKITGASELFLIFKKKCVPVFLIILYYDLLCKFSFISEVLLEIQVYTLWFYKKNNIYSIWLGAKCKFCFRNYIEI